MMQFSETLHLDCDCVSPEHTIRVSYEKETEDELDVESRYVTIDVLLVNHRGFLKRSWCAIKYIFGYKSRYGQYDEFLLNYPNAIALKDFIEQAYTNTESSE